MPRPQSLRASVTGGSSAPTARTRSLQLLPSSRHPAAFSKYSGGVIGQTLAMEGMFAFFLESAFVGALVWGEKRLGPRNHFLAAVGVAVGSWLSAYFILVTNAFMQHPVGYAVTPNGTLEIAEIGAYLLNPWAMVEFTHNQAAAVVAGSFAVTAMGAFYTLRKLYPDQARLYLKYGTAVGLVASILVASPAMSRPRWLGVIKK